MSPTRTESSGEKRVGRREFVKTTSRVTAAAALAPYVARAWGAPDKLRVGMVGCRRGPYDLTHCLQSSENVELVAVADLFPYNMETGMKLLAEEKELAGKLNVPPDQRFLGIDAYKQLVALPEVDMVILTTPAHFRPAHLRAAIEAGKHVFMEKPVAVDPAGVRSVLASAELAKEKGLSIVAGTQRRHQQSYVETIARIHDGALGEITGGACYWNTGYIHYHDRKPEWSDMEFQINNWLYFTWLSGDFIVEQHVHNIDVINWAMQAHPEKAQSMGGRQVRTGIERWGNVYDHFATEFTYPGGVVITSQCRQIDQCSSHVAEYLVGRKGRAVASGKIEGEHPWGFEGESTHPVAQEFADMIAGIRAGRPLNEGKAIAESSMTAILARMSAYTGKSVSWNWAMNASKLDYTPENYDMGPKPVDPVAVPGVTPLV